MAYGVYYKRDGSLLRAGEWVKSTRARTGEVFKDYRFETLAAAEGYENELKQKGYETKIKEVK